MVSLVVDRTVTSGSDRTGTEDLMEGEAQATVLVVDDEPELVSLYSAWLDDEYEVRTATGGEEAIESLDGEIDVVLLDRRMPGLTGDDVLETVRKQGLECRVGMITAVEPDVDIVDLPFDDYLVKPVDRHEITSIVDLLLQRADYDDQSKEFFMLASKKATLEAAEGEFRGTEEYAELTDRMSEIREEIDQTLDDLEAVDYEAAFRELK